MNEEKNIPENSSESNFDLENQEMAKNETLSVNNEEVSSIEDPKPIKNNMEVHHHPDIHHKAKPWKEYLLEFLMIFLAVTMGFFAENIWEHIVDSKKERHLMMDLTKDINDQAKDINGDLVSRNNRVVWIDSLVLCLKNPTIQTYGRNIFDYYFLAQRNQTFVLRDAALQQIKSSANLRLIENKVIVEKILSIDSWSKFIELSDQKSVRALENFKIASAKVFDGFYLTDSLPKITLPDYIEAVKNKPASDKLKYCVTTSYNNTKKAFTSEKSLVSELLVQCYNLRLEVFDNGVKQKEFLDGENSLLELIQKEYNIKISD